MESLDLDAFIANIEQSAPKEENDGHEHRCQECDIILEEVDGNFVCPNCSAQATDILQLEETELHYNEAGIAIVGQRVMNTERKKKHTIDYGWAWSTDEAIVHILSSQLEALEKIGLVPDYFKIGVKNMWYKFWVDTIAPYIKDSYSEEELTQISVDSALKLRDIEVLVKVQDKVMIPAKGNLQGELKKWDEKMMGATFYKANASEDHPTNCDIISDDTSSQPILQETSQKCSKIKTRNLNTDTIAVLTLNRTLAFIEGAARCLNLPDPIFASDIIRACNQRLIPFFGAHKNLPEGMRFNKYDKLMFQKNRPPTPIQLSRTASLLVHRLYKEKLPLLIPVPDLETILKRFIVDMNLPNDLLNYFKRPLINFSCFKKTQPFKLCQKKAGITPFPQYDRWAFSILVFHLKRLFVLDQKGLDDQRKVAEESGRSDVFIFQSWIRQMSIRLHLIMSYDSYMLFHPMANMCEIQSTPQLYNYVETLLGDRVIQTIRVDAKRPMTDDEFRSEFTEFLKREIPRPPHLDREQPDEKNLQKPIHLRFPIQDAFTRTQRFWIPEIKNDQKLLDLIFQDYTNQKILTYETDRKWTVYDDNLPANLRQYGMSPNWPYCFKLLLSIGGYLCYCEPDELLNEYRYVEEFIYPHMKIMVKTRNKQTN